MNACIPCPSNSDSLPGSSSVQQCSCDAGFVSVGEVSLSCERCSLLHNCDCVGDDCIPPSWDTYLTLPEIREIHLTRIIAVLGALAGVLLLVALGLAIALVRAKKVGKGVAAPAPAGPKVIGGLSL